MAAEVGIIISAADKASAVFQKVRNAGSKSFESIGKAAVVLNQALELGKKAFEILHSLIFDNVAAMIEYRGETDKISKQFKKMADDAQFLRATLANVLVPIFLGLRDAINKTGNQFIELVNANKQLIATNLTVWLADVARIAVKGVAGGILLISKAYSGWIELINVVKFAFEKQFELILTGVSAVVGHLADLASVLDEDLAASMREVAAAADQMADEFEKSGDDSLKKVEEQIAKQQEFEDTLKKFKDVAVDFVGEAEVAILKRIAAGWTNVKRHTEAATDAIKNQREAFESLRVSSADHFTRLADFQEKDAAFFESQAVKMGEVAQAQVGMISQIGGAFENATGSMIAGQEAFGKIAVKTALSVAKIIILTAAAEAAAKAFAAHQFLPFVGIAVGSVAAGVAFATVEALLSDLPAAAQGGRVRGGTPGVDSVGVLVQEGEGILKTGQTSAITRLADALENNPRASTAGLNLTFAPRIDMLEIPEPARRKKFLTRLGRDMEDLVADGVILRNLVHTS